MFACDEPFANEIHDGCKLLKLESVMEAKHYPRDWLPRGRIRVQLKGDDGKLVNPEIPDRRTLLIRLAEVVAKQPGRNSKGRQQAAKPVDAGAGASGSSSSAAAGGSKPAPSKKGKKGKK